MQEFSHSKDQAIRKRLNELGHPATQADAEMLQATKELLASCDPHTLQDGLFDVQNIFAASEQARELNEPYLSADLHAMRCLYDFVKKLRDITSK